MSFKQSISLIFFAWLSCAMLIPHTVNAVFDEDEGEPHFKMARILPIDDDSDDDEQPGTLPPIVSDDDGQSTPLPPVGNSPDDSDLSEEIQRILKVVDENGALNLAHQKIDDKRAIAIAAALPQHAQKLTTLDLYVNKIGAKGARALAKALPALTNLQFLDISENEIGVEGARAILNALPDCSQLTTLDLYDTKIGDEGAASLAADLTNCSQLTTLSLSDNGIGDEGAKAIVTAALKNCSRLTTLHLYGNKVSAKQIAELEQLGQQSGMDIGFSKTSTLEALQEHFDSIRATSLMEAGRKFYGL